MIVASGTRVFVEATVVAFLLFFPSTWLLFNNSLIIIIIIICLFGKTGGCLNKQRRYSLSSNKSIGELGTFNRPL